MAIDIYGRLRISDAFTIFDYYPTALTANSNLDEDKWISSTVGGTQTYNAQNFINMSISGSNKYIIRYSKFPLLYQTGKSRLVYMSGVLMASPGTNNEARIGIFNIIMDQNLGLPVLTNSLPTINEGIYLKTDGTTLFFCNITQTNPTEILNTNVIQQTNWNIDIFDGKGPSGKTLTSSNISQVLLIVIDQEWLGGGRTRCGFLLNGNIYYAHQFINNDVVQSYSTPNVRLCYYLNSKSLSTGTPIMKQICSSANCEGLYKSIGKYKSVSTGLTNVTISTTNKSIIMAIRIKRLGTNCSYPNGIFSLYNLNLCYNGGSSNKILNYEVQIHSTFGSIGTVTGLVGTWIAVKDSIIEYYIGTGQYIAPTYDGYICIGGYSVSSYQKNYTFNNTEILLSNLSCSQYDTMYIIGLGSQNNYTCNASADIIEKI
jgi:hypothetical protein